MDVEKADGDVPHAGLGRDCKGGKDEFGSRGSESLVEYGACVRARAYMCPCSLSPDQCNVFKIEDKDICARISADGTVTFFDATPEFSKEDLVRLLQDVQNQGEHLQHLERNLSKDREYLKKVRVCSFWAKQKKKSKWLFVRR